MAKASGRDDKQEMFDNRLEDLRRLERALHTASAHMANETKYEDVTVFLGNTRSGKSSLINYLIGNKLIGEKITKSKPLALKKADDSDGPKIGIGAKSETMIPTRWVSKKLPHLGLWDAPGFCDNRGVVQDITNAFYISELFKNVKSAKIILVTDISDIASDSITPFLSLLTSVQNLLRSEMKECISNIGLVLTKVPEELNDCRVDKDFISELLKDQFLSSCDIAISEPAKDLIQFLIQNDKRIGHFKKVNSGEVKDLAIDYGIIEAIVNVGSVQNDVLKNVSPSIADDSKIFLYCVREQLSAMKTFHELQNVLLNIHDTMASDLDMIRASDNVSVDDLFDINKEISITADKMKQVLDSNASFQKKIEALQTIDPSIAKLIKDHNLIEKAKLMEFVDSVLDMKESNEFNFKLKGTLLSAMSKFHEFSTFIRLKSGKITETEASAAAMKAIEEYKERMKILEIELKKVRDHNKKTGSILGPIAKYFAQFGTYLDNWLGYNEARPSTEDEQKQIKKFGS